MEWHLGQSKRATRSQSGKKRQRTAYRHECRGHPDCRKVRHCYGKIGRNTFYTMGMLIDGNTAYIMTSNFSRSALGGSSGSSGNTNREYGIIDTNPQDGQALSAIFNADWNRTTAQFNDPNLVVSPVNSRNAFNTPISNAHSTPI